MNKQEMTTIAVAYLRGGYKGIVKIVSQRQKYLSL